MKPSSLSLSAFAFALGLVALSPAGCGGDDKPGSGSPPAAGAGGAAGTGGRAGAPAGNAGAGGGGAAGSAGTGGSAGGGGNAGTGGVRPPDAGGRRPDAGPRAPDAGAVRRDGGAGTPDSGGASADTWESYAKGFFASYCVSCHNDDNRGAATRDYHVLANVVLEKAEIACGVAKSMAEWTARGCTAFPPARQFPVGAGPKPADADRDRLLRWIDSGAR
jgi:hypothetical protein